MDFAELNDQLPSKRRSVQDLIRFITTRTDDNPNYCLLFGAGCSITSGVRSATTLTELWRAEIIKSLPLGSEIEKKSTQEQKEYLRSTQSTWYDEEKEYSSLFERRYDLQRQRRMFVEKEVSGAFPSIGYLYLTSLVSKGFLRNIFTTNFDDLLNEAFYLYSTDRPIVCAHDSSINSITVTSRRPKIIKLHGDYLFDDLKSTLRETESLEQNMKAKFAEFLKESGLIVVGYSGSDRSIMDTITSLLKSDEYLKSGIYWCLRRDTKIPEELRRLFWRDRVYFVEIDGFDDLFAEIYSGTNNGDILPSAGITPHSRNSDTIEKLLSIPNAIPATSEILRQARGKLEKITKRSAIASQIVRSDDEEKTTIRGQAQDLTDDELLLLTEAEALISQNKYVLAIEKIRSALQNQPSRLLRRRLLNMLIQAHRLDRNPNAALDVAEQLIAHHPYQAGNYLLKSRIDQFNDRKLVSIDKAIEVDPHYYQAYLAKARHLRDVGLGLYNDERICRINMAEELLDKCLTLNPSASNAAWRDLFFLLRKSEPDKAKRKLKQAELISKLNTQNPRGFLAIELQTENAIHEKDKDEAQRILDFILDTQGKFGFPDYLWTVDFEIRLLTFLQKDQHIIDKIAQLRRDGNLFFDTDIINECALALRKRIGNDNEALQLLHEGLREWDFSASILKSIIRIYIDHKDGKSAKTTLEKWGHRIVPEALHEIENECLEVEGKFDEIQAKIRLWNAKCGKSEHDDMPYTLICAGKYEQAENYLREKLEPINYTTEAEADIINLELARKLRGKHPDQKRLGAVLSYTSDPKTKAAAYCILGKSKEMIECLKEELLIDKTFFYTIHRWPVFKDVAKDPSILRIIGNPIALTSIDSTK